MKRKEKATDKGTTLPVGVAVGVLVSIVMTLLCSILLAWLISSEKMSMGAVDYAAGVAILLSSTAGAWIAVGRIKRLRTQVCLITGAAYYLVLLTITAIFYNGQYRGAGLSAILVIIFSPIP